MTLHSVFFGTPDIAVDSLNALSAEGHTPSLIVTAPDKPQGRGLEIVASPVKTWAIEHGVPHIQPTTLRDEAVAETLRKENADVFIVVAYGKLIPKDILDIPAKGTLNMHPSLLPKHRGPSPIESQVLTEQNPSDVGVSIMLLDEEMDHGPVVAQAAALPELMDTWPIRASELRPLLSQRGAELLAETILSLERGELTTHEQDHARSTYCTKISKDDAKLDLSGDAEKNYRTFLAYDIWPRTFFYAERHGKPIRVIITDATLKDGIFTPVRVIPEGKHEMHYEEFLRSLS